MTDSRVSEAMGIHLVEAAEIRSHGLCAAVIRRGGEPTDELCRKPDGHKSAHSAWWPAEQPSQTRQSLVQVKITRAGGYDPKLGPNHPDNRDPTLEPGVVAARRITGDGRISPSMPVITEEDVDELREVVPRPLAEAPKDATEILAWTTDRYGNRRWLVVHWAQGGGEEQPPFRGWFYNLADGYSEIDPKHILGWLPLPDRKLVKL